MPVTNLINKYKRPKKFNLSLLRSCAHPDRNKHEDLRVCESSTILTPSAFFFSFFLFYATDNAHLLFHPLSFFFSFLFSFLTFREEDKMVAGGDENKSHPSLFIRHEKDTQ